MNTNNNVYTVIYTVVVCVLVAAILAFVSQSLKSRQEANEKADTISQMLTAAKFGTKKEFQDMGNAAVIAKYASEVEEAFTVNAQGQRNGELKTGEKDCQIYSESALKAQNYNIRDGKEAYLPVFRFKNGRTVVPVYGAGLWGPIWGYIAFEPDMVTMVGAYFDHASETAGLGAKIKDDPKFQGEFVGEKADFSGNEHIFEIVKGGAPKDAQGNSLVDNKIDAISGATMTSKGLAAAIDTWLGAYKAYFTSGESAACCPEGECSCEASQMADCCE